MLNSSSEVQMLVSVLKNVSSCESAAASTFDKINITVQLFKLAFGK